ncbi:hypothetical protein FACS1894123_11130 [Bacteroidia bacterium]|nr:hypothetical protein FACS1894123_11130 [Bacteroidia bacterium]
MQRLPSEVDEHGLVHPRGFIDEAETGMRLASRIEARDLIVAASRRATAIGIPNPGPNERDNPDLLIDPGAPSIRNLREMQARGLAVPPGIGKHLE